MIAKRMILSAACACGVAGFAADRPKTDEVAIDNAAEVRRTVTVPGLGPDAHYAVLRGVKGEKVAEMTGRELAERGFEGPVDGELFEIRRTEWRSDSTKTVERKW